jgi:acyl-coenzyme A synthetase/AMP-(fatty) acid ligase
VRDLDQRWLEASASLPKNARGKVARKELREETVRASAASG